MLKFQHYIYSKDSTINATFMNNAREVIMVNFFFGRALGLTETHEKKKRKIFKTIFIIFCDSVYFNSRAAPGTFIVLKL